MKINVEFRSMKRMHERERKTEWVTGSEKWKELDTLQFPYLHIIANKKNIIACSISSRNGKL